MRAPRFRVPLVALVGALIGGGCADDPVTDGSSVSVTTGVNGSTGAHGTSTSAGHTTSAGTGTGGAGGMASMDEAPWPIVLAHGFFGFDDFAGAGFLSYFYGVKDDLAAHGEVVYTPAVDPFNDSTFRGAQLYEAIEKIKAETGKRKVVVIGHSQGGLDARVVAHDHPDSVAAVITIATPHHGTPVADIAMKLLADPNASAIVDALVNAIGAEIYDTVGNETAVSKPLKLFAQPGIQAFNALYTDAPGVFYASIGGRSDMDFGGQDCAPTTSVPFIEAFDSDRDPLEPLLWVTAPILAGNGNKPKAHDGLVRAADARWGEFWGCIPADHMDEVGQIGGDNPGAGNGFEHKQFYRDLVAYLRALGY
ncbi:MAG: alpha/beta fold hydrolase [Polyangiaceae bacterium]